MLSDQTFEQLVKWRYSFCVCVQTQILYVSKEKRFFFSLFFNSTILKLSRHVQPQSMYTLCQCIEFTQLTCLALFVRKEALGDIHTHTHIQKGGNGKKEKILLHPFSIDTSIGFYFDVQIDNSMMSSQFVSDFLFLFEIKSKQGEIKEVQRH